MIRIGFIPAPVPLRTLNPANDTVQAGRYLATTLSTVDSDLATGNIKETVDIFGKVGTFAGGPPVYDIEGTHTDTDACGTGLNSTCYKEKTWSADEGPGSYACFTKTLAAAQSTVLFGFVAGIGYGSGAEKVKLQLYIDGVQVAESGWLVAPAREVDLIGHRDVSSGNRIIKADLYNYTADLTVGRMGGALGGFCPKV